MRTATKLESIVIWADDVWGNGEGVSEYVIDVLEKAGLIITMEPSEYFENEFGKDSPEYQENLGNYDFASMSVWTEKGNQISRKLAQEMAHGNLKISPKYGDFS